MTNESPNTGPLNREKYVEELKEEKGKSLQFPRCRYCHRETAYVMGSLKKAEEEEKTDPPPTSKGGEGREALDNSCISEMGRIGMRVGIKSYTALQHNREAYEYS